MFTSPITLNKFLIPYQYPTKLFTYPKTSYILLTFCYLLNIEPTLYDTINIQYVKSTFPEVFKAITWYSSIKTLSFPHYIPTSIIPILTTMAVVGRNTPPPKSFFKSNSIPTSYTKLLKLYDMDALKLGRSLIQKDIHLQQDLEVAIQNLLKYTQET